MTTVRTTSKLLQISFNKVMKSFKQYGQGQTLPVALESAFDFDTAIKEAMRRNYEILDYARKDTTESRKNQLAFELKQMTRERDTQPRSYLALRKPIGLASFKTSK